MNESTFGEMEGTVIKPRLEKTIMATQGVLGAYIVYDVLNSSLNSWGIKNLQTDYINLVVFRQRMWGSKKSKHFMDVIYGSPSSTPILF